MSFLKRLSEWLTQKEPERPPLQIKQNHFFWAFRNIPLKLAIRHFMVIGSTGSGKTTIIRLLMKSVLSRIGVKGDTNKRAVVYDNKREYVSLVHSMEPSAEVIIFKSVRFTLPRVGHLSGRDKRAPRKQHRLSFHSRGKIFAALFC